LLDMTSGIRDAMTDGVAALPIPRCFKARPDGC
jgi:hypothetical protein